MMAIMGLAGLLRFASCRWRWLGTAASVTWCASISVFGLGFILAGLFDRESIAGGIPLLPTSFNQALGSLAFIACGLGILALLPRLFRHQQDYG